MLTERVRRWRDEGATEDVLGRRLFVHRRGGSEAPLFLGFGLSEKPRDHVYTLAWQADAAEELVRRAGSPPVFVVGHDMGTSVATELMARTCASPT